MTQSDPFTLGQSARRRGEHGAALAHFRAAAAARPRDVAPLLEVAAELRELGRIGEAEAGYRAVLAEQAGQVQALLGLGHCARRRGDPAAALAHLQAAAEAPLSDIWRRLELAAELRELGQFEQAEAGYQAMLAEQPQLLHALLGLGHCARRRGDRTAALAHFREAAQAHPHEIGPLLEVAAELRELGRLGEAEAGYRAVLAKQDGQIQALLGLGHCARRRGDHAAALVHLRAAAAAPTSDIWRRLELAAELRELGQFEEAEAGYRAVLAEQPEQLHALLGQGHCARRRGDRTVALAHFRAAAQAHPSEIAALLEIGAELRNLGRIGEAEAAYRSALGLQPGQPQALLGLGHCARRRGDRAAALEHLLAAAEAPLSDIWQRLELAAELRELAQFAEAEAGYRAVLAEQPEQLQALLGLGHCARRRGDRAAALAHFRAAAQAHPGDPAPQLEIAADLRDQGDFAGAVATCEAVLEHHSTELPAWLSIGDTHVRAGQLEAALRTFQRATELWPALPQPRVQAARVQRLLGRHEASREALVGILEAAPDNAEAWQELGEQARHARKLLDAETLFRRALAKQPFSKGAVFGLSQTLLELGRPDEALAFLQKAGTEVDAAPDISAKRVQILWQLGRWDEALHLAREVARRVPHNFWIWCQRVELEMLTGNHAGPNRDLQNPPAGTTNQWSSIFRLRGLSAELHWDFRAAIEDYRRAQELNPLDCDCSHSLARALLLNLDIDAARDQLHYLAKLQEPSLSLQGRSSNISQTLLGQLLDEYMLHAPALREMMAISGQKPAERSRSLLSLVRRYPDYTPVAIAWLIALRQAGRIPEIAHYNFSATPGRIPRSIVQYWHSPDPPADLRSIMRSWQDVNQTFKYTLFDDNSAHDFLRTCTSDVLLAYQRVSEPAQKADIFRLAWLFARGGYYADADDRCLSSLEAIIPSSANLALYQEDLCTVGNNFIGAAPQHAVIGRALASAVEAVNRGDRDLLWLSTGPGLLTRALAQTIANSDPDCATWFDSLVLLERARINQAVTFHCMAAYKQTPAHWQHTFFRSKSRAA